MPQKTTKPKTPNAINEIFISTDYADKNGDWHVSHSPWKADQISKILTKNGIMPTNLAEVGCGAGEILNQLSLKYPTAQFTGYEVSPHAYKMCQSRKKDTLTFHHADLTQTNLKTPYDVLTCIDVFEHVEDYLGFIKALKPKAKHKVFHIPLDLNVNTVLRAKPIQEVRNSVGHLHYYTRETALETLKYCGYKIIDEAYTEAYWDRPSSTLRGKFIKPFRKLAFTLNPHLAVRLMGGCSLIVLAE